MVTHRRGAAPEVKAVAEPDPDETATETPPEPETPLAAAAAESSERSRSLFHILGSVVAPTTLLTALLFYFGWAHAYWFFIHFGFDISLLGLTTQDYLMRSVDALFVPLTLSLAVGLLLIWLHEPVAARLFAGPRGDSRRRTVVLITAALGLVLFVLGVAGFLAENLRDSYLLVYPLSLGAGTLLLSYAARLRRTQAVASGRTRATGLRVPPLVEAAGVFLLVAMSLFWAATNYAAAVGGTRARQYEREFRGYPEAILYSAERLHLDSAGVVETACGDEAGAGFRFRYDGLRLMLRSGGNYFLLPETWTQSDGMSIVVPEDKSVRLQFARASEVPAQSRLPAIAC